MAMLLQRYNGSTYQLLPWIKHGSAASLAYFMQAYRMGQLGHLVILLPMLSTATDAPILWSLMYYAV